MGDWQNRRLLLARMWHYTHVAVLRKNLLPPSSGFTWAIGMSPVCNIPEYRTVLRVGLVTRHSLAQCGTPNQRQSEQKHWQLTRCAMKRRAVWLLTFSSYPLQSLSGQIQSEDSSDKYRQQVPWNAGNFLTSCKPVSFSRRTLHHGVSK